MGIFATLSINDMQHIIAMFYYAECHYTECLIYCYAECHYAECRYAECRGAV
jgi:hypothetical protein